MNPTPGSIIANRFQLVRELGRGTMGTVWLAQHLTLDVRCAVKFMSVEAAREPIYTARFALEARAIAQIQSPNIVRVLDYDLWEGVPFIAMERLVGEDLGARLQRVQRFDAATTLRVVAQVARGLSRAHSAGIVHRDLKPENIFLAREGDDEVAKLVDFGIAKFEGRAGRRTQVGEVLGTPAYMSPEQARCAETIDCRADLWSLGAITFECLTGRLAFDGASLGDIFARILVEPIPVPSDVTAGLPPAFDAWFARAVSRDPEGRFADAREMSDALERALADGRRARLELVTSRTLHPAPRRRRSARPLALVGLAAGLIAVLASGTGLDRGKLEPRIRAAASTISRWVSRASPPASIPPVCAPDLTHTCAPAPIPPSFTPDLKPTGAPDPASALAPIPPSFTPDLKPTGAPDPASALAPIPPASASAPDPASALVPVARHRLRSPSHPLRAAAEAQRGSECAEGQRRCSGNVLQLCNAALDGWTDFVDCGPTARCDATASGNGPCPPLSAPDPALR